MDVQLTLAELTPAKEQLETLAAKAKIVDTKNLAVVHDTRIELRDARVALGKTGKALRDGALTFQKTVIAKEKELIAIIEPEETRLEAIEDELKLAIEIEKRRDELPSRLSALAAIGDDIDVTEEEMLKLDDAEFNEYRIQRIDAKLARDRAAHEAKVRADEEAARAKAAEEDRIRREKLEVDEKAAEEKRKAEQAIIDAERAEIEREKIRIAAEDKARKDAEELAERELQRKEREAQLERERVEREEQARIAREKEQQNAAEFKAWLATVGYVEGDKITTNADGTVDVWHLVGTYKPKN